MISKRYQREGKLEDQRGKLGKRGDDRRRVLKQKKEERKTEGVKVMNTDETGVRRRGKKRAERRRRIKEVV